MVFHNRLDCGYHFIKLAKDFGGLFNCPGENTEKKLKVLMKKDKKLRKSYLTN